MKPIAQMSWKECWKGFVSTCTKFKLSPQETLCLFDSLLITWIEEHNRAA